MEMAVQASELPDTGTLLRDGFRLGDWEVRPIEGTIEGPSGARHLQPKSMDVLVRLAGSAGQIVEREELISDVWGQACISDEPLTRCIHDIRRALSDARDHPTYIQTIPKRGYRLVAQVEPIVAREGEAEKFRRGRMFCRRNLDALAIAALIIMLVGALVETRSRPGVAPRENRSMAVLPFEGAVDSADAAWFGSGFARDLARTLSAAENLNVAADELSIQAYEPATDVLRIGRDLNVHYVMKGRVERHGDSLRVAVRLIDAQTRFRLWSRAYVRDIGDLFAIQEDIARLTLDALQVDIPSKLDAAVFALPGTLSPAVAAPTTSVDAYLSFLRARESIPDDAGAPAFAAAVDDYKRAIEADPEFARAYAGLCSALVRRVEAGQSDDSFALTQPVCEQGVDLDGDSVEARVALADLYRVTRQADIAIDAYRGIVRERPRAIEAYRGMARAYADAGEAGKAESAYRKAISVQPDHVPTYADFGAFLLEQQRLWRAAGRRA